ncbi:MAG: 2-oxo acid dehydrogenase subunit E2 [Acutalibacteraceae bacterium]|jgi:hypothetical protein
MRKDAYKLKGTDPMYTVGAHIMARRIDAMNMTTINIPQAPLHEYLNQKRKEGFRTSHLALIIAAYLRTVAEFPELNRFVVNKRLYARNELAVGMVVLKAGSATHGTMSKCYFDIHDTIFDVNEKITKYIEDNQSNESENSTDELITKLLRIPGLLRVGVPVLKWMDKHGWLPKSIIDASPFHMSLGITNLASIKTNHILHHCYDFGTTSIFLAIGNMREVPKRVGSEIVFERCLPIGVTMDERICSGAYFAIAFRKFRKILEHPEILEQPPETVVPDPNAVIKKKK